MKKKLIGMLCGAVVVSAALPALALETTFSGFLRTQGEVQTTRDAGGIAKFDKDVTAETFVAERLRMKITNKVNDKVSVVYFAEVNADWGLADKAATYSSGTVSNANGGKLSADGINLVTKNVYTTIKALDNLTFSVGIQGIADNFNNTFINDDAAALVAIYNIDALGLVAGWSKFDEGALADADDTDLYFVQAGYKVSDAIKAGLDIYYTNAQGTKNTDDERSMYTIGPYVKAAVAGINLDGFFAYQGGTKKNGAADDTKYAAFAGTVGAGTKVAMANVGLRVIYYSADSDLADDTVKCWTGDLGGLSYAGEGLNIFLADLNKTTNANDRGALAAVANGNGLLGIVLKAGFELPAASYANIGLGYFQALNDDGREGKNLGTEIAFNVGTKIAEAATLSLRGSYALLGDYYDNTATGAEDPDNAYMASLMLNVPF